MTTLDTLRRAYLPLAKARINAMRRAVRLYGVNRSWRPLPVLAAFLWETVRRRPHPAFMTVAVTYRCMNRCVHCYASAPRDDGRGELSADEIKGVLGQAAKMGVLQVIFSGGEPLLREDLPELVRFAHGAGLLTRVNTNGFLLEKERVRRLKDAGLTQCGVSIDDADPTIHDKLRGLPGAFNRAVEGLRVLREEGVPAQILTYASKANAAGGLERIIDLGKELGVMSVYVFFPVAVGRWEDARTNLLTEEEKARIRALQDTTFVHIELPSPRYRCCVVTKSLVYVSPAGDVTPCPFVPFVVGNVKVHALKELWRRYCDHQHVDCRGDCPLNIPESRDALEAQIESAASCCGDA